VVFDGYPVTAVNELAGLYKFAGQSVVQLLLTIYDTGDEMS
jgi:hypothetical protein